MTNSTKTPETNKSLSSNDHSGLAMNARTVRFDLVKGKQADFTKLFNSEVLPMLRKQDGFKNEVLLVRDDHVIGISMWSSPESLKKYVASTYSTIEKTLSPVLSGKPMIETYALATD